MSSLDIPPYRGAEPGLTEEVGVLVGAFRGPTVDNVGGTLGDQLGGAEPEEGPTIVPSWGGLREAIEKGGEPVSRQLSRSHFVPSSLEGYGRHLRQTVCEGYLKRLSRTTGNWRRRYFLLKDGYLSYFRDAEEAGAYRDEKGFQLRHHPSSQRRLAMDTVEAVRTEEKMGTLAFRVISSDRDDLVLRAESKEGMTEWRWGFFSSQQSIIARYMEAGWDSWTAKGDWSSAFQGGGGGAGGGGAEGGGGGGGGGGGVDRSSGLVREVPRVSGAVEVKKSAGCGQGRARRLTLRQCPMGHSFNSLSHPGQRTPVNGGDHWGSVAVAAQAGDQTGVWAGPGGLRAGAAGERHPRTNGAHASGGPAVGHHTHGRSVSNGVRIGGGRDGANGALPPKPSRPFQDAASRAERRRRAESMGSFASTLGINPSGLWPDGANADAAGGTPFVRPAAGRMLLSRTVSAGTEPIPTQMPARLIGDRVGGARAGRELAGFRASGCAMGEAPDGGTSAVEAAASAVYGSSEDDAVSDDDRSSESAQGSTTSDDADIEGPDSSFTSQDTVALSLGVDREPRDFVPAPPASKEERPKYLPPHKRGVAGAGGAGKYVPPALRAARTEGSNANAPAKLLAEVSMRGGGFEGGGDAKEGDGDGGRAIDAILSPEFYVSDDEPEDDEGGDDVIFHRLETDEPSCQVLEGGGGPSRCSSGATTMVDSVAENAPAEAEAGSVEGERTDGITRRAVLPNGRVMPWEAARRDHYYTGDYHSRLPCSPDGACNVKGGGRGGGRTCRSCPRDEKTPLRSSSPGVDTPQEGQGSTRGGAGGVLEKKSGVAGERLGVDGGPRGGAGGIPSRLVENGDKCMFPRSEGLWWTCGAWSIVGRREKQEDRFLVMPDFWKTIELVRDEKAGMLRREIPSSERCGSQRSPAGANRDSMDEAAGVVTAESDGEVAALFGVYDGHCGSEAVQFVSDRLHRFVGGHEDLEMTPRVAIREACLAVDDEFLAMAEERGWYSGTTVLVALLQGRKLTIGNIGDGEAVLARTDEVVEMSPVHNPGRKDESERISRANGWVTTEQELFLRQLKQMDLNDPQIRMTATDHVRWTTITRVCGELAVSRSIGDRDFKGFTKRRIEEGTDGVSPLEMSVFAWPRGHSRRFRDDLLTAEPEFMSAEIGPGDDFLLMACDGVWDVLGKEEAVEHARKFFDEGFCSQVVAERMCELAYRMGTSDNVTVVIVQFHHEHPGGSNAQEA